MSLLACLLIFIPKTCLQLYSALLKQFSNQGIWFHIFTLSLSEAVDEAVRIITGGLPEIAMEGNGPVENNAMLNKAVKRSNEDSDDDEEKGSVVPPVHDIYRARQQKRIR